MSNYEIKNSVAEKQLTTSKRPQLLFIGNGINRAFYGGSWYDALEKIKTREDIDVRKLKSPMPLMATLVTGNRVATAVAEHKKVFFGRNLCPEQNRLISDMLSFGFDGILTTNYSYELEVDAEGRIPDEKTLDANRSFNRCDARKGAETVYMLHTYNRETSHGKSNCIWHIHGEAGKPGSIIIGHYFYGNLLNKMNAVASKNYCQLCADGNMSCPSWVDAFMFGDVYMLGFGFDFSEFDLWWLVNRKQREKDQPDKGLKGLNGRVYWYEPSIYTGKGEIHEKKELLTSMGVVCQDCGYTAWVDGIISKKEGDREYFSDYRQFYFDAFEDIKSRARINGQKTPLEK